MRPKLSQPGMRPADDDRSAPPRVRARGWATLVAALLSLAALGACNRVDGEVERGAPPDAAVEAKPFVWPAAESHPRLRIAVDDGPVEGTIEIELMPELAPFSVLRIADLARNGYYDGTTFHRVIPGFMIQGGDPNSRDRDPTNDGHGDSDVRLDDEFGDAPFVRGVVGLANLGRSDSTGTQLFIMLDDHRGLDGHYTVIGRVVAGMDVVDAIAGVEIDDVGRWGPKHRPIENVVLSEVTIAEPSRAPVPASAATASAPQGSDRDRTAD